MNSSPQPGTTAAAEHLESIFDHDARSIMRPSMVTALEFLGGASMAETPDQDGAAMNDAPDLELTALQALGQRNEGSAAGRGPGSASPSPGDDGERPCISRLPLA